MNDKHSSPLFDSMQADDLATFRRLLEFGSDPNQEGPKGRTPLNLAVEHRNPDFALALLDAGADPWCRDADSFNALHHAVLWRRYDLLGRILTTPMPQSEREAAVSAVRLAAVYDDARSIEMLHGAGADLDHVDRTGLAPLRAAVMADARDAVVALIRAGADMTPLRDNQKSTTTPPEPGPGPDSSARLESGDKSTRQIRRVSSSALLDHVLAGDERRVLHCLQFGDKPNLPGPEGRLPLIEAVINEDAAMVELLLCWGADPDLKDERGRTALHAAAACNNSTIVLLLLTIGDADLWAMDDDGATPLAMAIRSDATDVANFLRIFMGIDDEDEDDEEDDDL